jgi:hypothetical protein
MNDTPSIFYWIIELKMIIEIKYVIIQVSF